MLISNSPDETLRAGARCAAGARVGDVFALRGEIGAGKTHFVKGFVAGMGSGAEVTSPTFVLVHEYNGGRCAVYHFDFYRVDSAEALLQLGLDEDLYGDGVCIIEWADRFPALLPKAATWISFAVTSELTRAIRIQDTR